MGHFISACLRRAGEIHPTKSVSEEVNDNGGFSQFIRNRTVHLLSIFLMLYLGVEVTIGGILFVNNMISEMLFMPFISNSRFYSDGLTLAHSRQRIFTLVGGINQVSSLECIERRVSCEEE